MKRLIILGTLLICGTAIFYAQQPEKIYSIAVVHKPHSYYITQAELWWKELEKNKTDEDAWYNYFKANRYAKATYKNIYGFDGLKHEGWLDESEYLKEAEEIVELADLSIPNTFTSNYLKTFGQSADDEKFPYLKKAYEINPNRPETYDGFIVYYETHNIPEKRKEFNLKWYHSNNLSSGFLAYNYNVLMTMKYGGIILTFGDNDTFPVWMLQDAMNIRTDVTVLNVPLLCIPEYRDAVFEKLHLPKLKLDCPHGSTSECQKAIVDHIIRNKTKDMNLYISTPAWKEYKEYENNLYLVGLLLQYSEENVDNMALLKNNFENRYALDYISQRFVYDISQSLVDRTNVNYLPAIIKLYEHYVLSGDKDQAEKIKQLGLHIAEKGGTDWKEKVLSIFE